MTDADHARRDRALRRARRWALLDITIPALWLSLGALLTWYGFPWSSRQYEVIAFPVLAVACALGLLACVLGGFWIDRGRGEASLAIGVGFRLAMAGGVVAGLALLATLAPLWVETRSEGSAIPTLTGSRETDLLTGAVLGLVPLLLAAGNGLAWARIRRTFDSL